MVRTDVRADIENRLTREDHLRTIECFANLLSTTSVAPVLMAGDVASGTDVFSAEGAEGVTQSQLAEATPRSQAFIRGFYLRAGNGQAGACSSNGRLTDYVTLDGIRRD